MTVASALANSEAACATGPPPAGDEAIGFDEAGVGSGGGPSVTPPRPAVYHQPPESDLYSLPRYKPYLYLSDLYDSPRPVEYQSHAGQDAGTRVS